MPGAFFSRLLSRLVRLSLALCLMPPSLALTATLKDVEFATLPGNQVRLDLVLSESPPQAKDFSTTDPARIVVDLPGVIAALPRKNVAIDAGPVQGLSALAA